jgi:hypothetical protein
MEFESSLACSQESILSEMNPFHFFVHQLFKVGCNIILILHFFFLERLFMKYHVNL